MRGEKVMCALVLVAGAGVVSRVANAKDVGYPSYSEWYAHEGICYNHDEFDDNTPTMDERPVGTPPRPFPNLDCWLTTAHPDLARYVVFEFPNPVGALPYAQWPMVNKQALWTAFQQAWSWYENGYPAGTPDAFPMTDPKAPLNTYGTPAYASQLTPEDAWAYYVDSVGISLAAELGHWFKWTLRPNGTYLYTDTPGWPSYANNYDMQQFLFDSRWMFTYYTLSSGPPGYLVRARATDLTYTTNTYSPVQVKQHFHGDATPTSPMYTLQWFRNAGLAAGDYTTTLDAALAWGRSHLFHFDGLDYFTYWQYQGSPPVARIIDGTNSTDPSTQADGVQHWTAGCYGTLGFYMNIFRVANIVTMPAYVSCPNAYGQLVASHAQICFPAAGTCISHADDIYDQGYADALPYPGYSYPAPPNTPAPISKLRTDIKTITWDFANTGMTNPQQACSNVDISALSTVLTYTGSNYMNMPHTWMAAYCNDLRTGATHDTGQVFAKFLSFNGQTTLPVYDFTSGKPTGPITVAKLESKGLWTALQSKLQATPSGCSAYPY